MSSRHIPTKRIRSGVLFSAPANMPAILAEVCDLPNPDARKGKREMRPQANPYPWRPSSMNCASVMPYPDVPGPSPQPIQPPSDQSSRKPSPAPPREVTLCLPILSVSVKATVDGRVAQTELVQSFRNPSDIEIPEARHIFPLYDGAVITSFECTISDELRIRGVVRPKEQARDVYRDAVQTRPEAAALLQELSPEVFETSLGHIPAHTNIEIRLTYVNELKVVMMEKETAEGVAVTIPTSVAPRYSKGPPKWKQVPSMPENKLDILVRVVDNGEVNHHGCEIESGHDVQFEELNCLPDVNVAEEDPKTFYIWHHESKSTILKKDFVLVVQMREGYSLRSRATIAPTDSQGQAAMMVSIKPSDLFGNAIRPQSFKGEILFLLDQSGSMGDYGYGYNYNYTYNYSYGCQAEGRGGPRKIDTMRDAMFLVLSGIPSTCIFNIISWGTATYGMWDKSRPHSAQNIKEAKNYVSQIEADMGGTDLLRALDAAVARRMEVGSSTQIIIVTDGELDPDDAIKFVWKTRQRLHDRVRFFALGIGDNVSHRLVESIAELGGGFCDVIDIVQKPRWEDRLNRMLRSALEPDSWRCDVSLGSGYERRSLMRFQLGVDEPSNKAAVPYFQAPYPIPSLHPFTYKSIYFLIDLRDGKRPPAKVIVTTTTSGAKAKTYELDIEKAAVRNGMIHQLAAKAALLSLEEEVKRDSAGSHIARKNGESIGMAYSISSKWTSFVAVITNQQVPARDREIDHYKAIVKDIDIEELLVNADTDDDEETESVSGAGSSELMGSTSGYSTFSFSLGQTMSKSVNVKSLGMEYTRGASQVPSTEDVSQWCGKSYGKAGTHSASSARHKAISDRSSYDIKGLDIHGYGGVDYGSDDFKSENDLEVLSYQQSPNGPFTWQVAVACQNDEGLFELLESRRVKLQLHFCLNTAQKLGRELQKLLSKVPGSTEEESSEAPCETLVDTLMTIQYFRTHLATEEDTWNLMMERAQDAVLAALGLSDDEEELLEAFMILLEMSMMHEHYVVAVGGAGAVQEKGSSDSSNEAGKNCPICGLSAGGGGRFLCPFDHPSDGKELGLFHSWDAFWQHQIKSSHMVCPVD
ncbi:hypothetical protein FOVG_18808 [Fusarium oxysporum f. sp. pisi HDV247]|uniref:VWFA domain-containing protein n=1 Tax=Fusarium oxysporum f. sp. pisi HDV247 TaxID=1080344 RepID=W9NI86_FUSOX|nr:hypothetical protein FOVG_18808 [Fusarium oxysporum f. sp. pisi HDV247]